ncbi:general transcription factor II-I repeat domain-containing protein 1-like [Xenia sp. Carnegie-2017]|uniref:general transcription factor II-I repeat domain-containing protein 1-like n=1 Tax=Xenia sp. Carnegie-2017 TaxID=2897299 RepID=UPI001F042F52|nr:general transcription factor II-I repeat domain-containing protein 1-like [Xenia sp. Carnegie-2017]
MGVKGEYFLTYLESLGCEAVVLFLEPGDSCLQQFGTEKGINFLNKNEKIGVNFVEYLDSPKQVVRKYRVCDVIKLFNQKYSEACGKMCRVPYLKGGFTVTGLPEGITFKKPSQYGIKQISNMKNAQNIHFKIIESPQVEKVLTENRKYSDQERECYRSVLKKVVFEEAKVSMCLIRNKLIEECDLVVTDVDLTKSELDLLTGKLKNFFKPDAFATLIANCKSSRTHEGYILPVYTD